MGHGTELLQTLTVTVFAAVSLMILASRLRVPAIVLLLFGGIVLGPEVLHVVEPDVLGGGLATVISLAVAVILFEGGLTLEIEGFRLAPSVINRMLTIGIVVTWAGTTALIVLLFDYPASFAILAASLTIVTGPTVIGPILRRVRVGQRLHQILHWEAVLIDPIGVFLALASFEWLLSQAAALPVAYFFIRFALAVPVGALVGWLVDWILRRDWIDKEWDNLFVFATALLTFGVCDIILSESGLLAVTVAGFVLGSSHSKRVKRVKQFKVDITQLAIGVLFVLLSARLDLQQFVLLGGSGVLLIVAMAAIIRPLNVLVSTWRSPVPWNERWFLAFLAPRGIVAASMASLFTLRMAEHPRYGDDAWFLEVFTYAVIGATVVGQGLGARWVAQWLGVTKPHRLKWLIVGSRYFGQDLGSALHDAGIPVLLVDSNTRNIRDAKRRGLDAIEADILDVNLFDDARFADVGNMLCVTGNSVLDELACHRWREMLGAGRGYRWSDAEEDEPADDAAAGVRRGTPVWPNAPTLRSVETDLLYGERAVVLLKAGDGADTARGAVRLFDITGDAATLQPEGPPVEVEDSLPACIVLTETASPLYSPVRAVVTCDQPQPNLRTVLAELLQTAARFEPNIPTDDLLDRLVEREEDLVSYVGNGVFMPHTYSRHTDEALCVVGRLDSPLDLDTYDERPVELVFLLISPRDHAKAHLEALGQLARLTANEKVLRRIREAESDEASLRVVRKEHRRLAMARD